MSRAGRVLLDTSVIIAHFRLDKGGAVTISHDTINRESEARNQAQITGLGSLPAIGLKADGVRDHVGMNLSGSSALGHLHPGFMAMEYFALILNRSFLVFITDEGLRGWKFVGPVSTKSPQFYKPIEELLDDPEMSPGSAAFNELMCGPNTFVIAYGEIRSVDFSARTKWGMGGILHSGILSLGLSKGKNREFILLGAAYGEGIRNSISMKISGRVSRNNSR
jgi:hypothetical protein